MEYANDEIFKVRYNTRLDRLEVEKESWTSKIVKKISKHKLLTMSILAFFIFSTINTVMIINFLKLLQNL